MGRSYRPKPVSGWVRFAAIWVWVVAGTAAQVARAPGGMCVPQGVVESAPVAPWPVGGNQTSGVGAERWGALCNLGKVESGLFDQPLGISVSDEHPDWVFVADSRSGVVGVVDVRDGRTVGRWGGLGFPYDVHEVPRTDGGAGGILFAVSDIRGGCVRLFRDGRAVGGGEFCRAGVPTGLATWKIGSEASTPVADVRPGVFVAVADADPSAPGVHVVLVRRDFFRQVRCTPQKLLSGEKAALGHASPLTLLAGDSCVHAGRPRGAGHAHRGGNRNSPDAIQPDRLLCGERTRGHRVLALHCRR